MLNEVKQRGSRDKALWGAEIPRLRARNDTLLAAALADESSDERFPPFLLVLAAIQTAQSLLRADF
jgi:hypothetical protein